MGEIKGNNGKRAGGGGEGEPTMKGIYRRRKVWTPLLLSSNKADTSL